MASDPENFDIFLQHVTGGGIVADPELAQKLATVLIEHAHGADELSNQLPLNVADEGDCWCVSGSAPTGADEFGEIIVRLSKRDGRVINFHHMVHHAANIPPI